jgi:hypothetical protein
MAVGIGPIHQALGFMWNLNPVTGSGDAGAHGEHPGGYTCRTAGLKGGRLLVPMDVWQTNQGTRPVVGLLPVRTGFRG